MKKHWLLFLFLFTSISLCAQQNNDPAAMRQRLKEKVRPELVQKAGITDEQASQVIDIWLDGQRQYRAMRNDTELSVEDKAKKSEEIAQELKTKYTELGLSEEKVLAITDYFEERRKKMPPRN